MNRLFIALFTLAAIARPASAGPPPPVVPCAETGTVIPSCGDLVTAGQTVVYAMVGDTQNNLMRRLARLLRDNTDKKLTLAWFTSGSCANIATAYTRQNIPTAQVMSYVPSIAENGTWTPEIPPPPATPMPTCRCTIPAATPPDVINSALFNSACPSGEGAVPPFVKLTQGPVQAYVLAVPEASTQTAITFEEAYFVFGFGTAGMALPWVDEAQMFIRTVSKSTLVAWAKNIGVDPMKWKGVRRDGSPMVVADLEGTTSPEQAIGILGAEVYDAERAKLNVLAYKSKGQYYAYYPDSTSTSFDKKNVRDGHYTVWSPTIWMDYINETTQVATNLNARYIIDIIAGKSVTPAASFDTIDPVAKVGLVPDCAMRVTRSFEGGPLSLYTPTESCTCKYESIVDTTTCAQCSGSQPCASGTCRNGYCEVQ